MESHNHLLKTLYPNYTESQYAQCSSTDNILKYTLFQPSNIRVILVTGKMTPGLYMELSTALPQTDFKYFRKYDDNNFILCKNYDDIWFSAAKSTKEQDFHISKHITEKLAQYAVNKELLSEIKFNQQRRRKSITLK